MQRKRKYIIYTQTRTDYGDGRMDKSERRVGETWAVSKAQAVNNYCYREGVRAYQCAEWSHDGLRETEIIAKEA